MAALSIYIENGILTVYGGGRTEQYVSADYRAKTWRNGDRDGIVIFPLDGDSTPYSNGTFTFKALDELTLYVNGSTVSLVDAIDAVDAFNRAAGTNFGYNTQYPQHILSSTFTLDTSVPMSITQGLALAKGGYVTLTAHDDNAGVIYIGDEDVDDQCYALDAGDSVFMELDRLENIYVYAEVADCIIKVLGAYKY